MAANIPVAKKTSPNGKLTVYVGNRNLVDRIDTCDPVEGVILVDEDYLKGRKVYGQLIMRYQYGRDDDEVMGIKFSREYMLCRQQIYPPPDNSPVELSPMQTMLVDKFQAHPFAMDTPENSPSSVELQLGLKEKGCPMGVFYRLECYVAQEQDDIQRKRNMITMDITKLQRVMVQPTTRQPHITVCKSPTLGSGRIDLEIVLDRAVYYHGQNVMANVNVMNGSNQKIEKIKNSVVQMVNVTMINCDYSLKVATLKTKDGCPIRPGGRFSQTFILTPLAISNRSRRAVALEGRLRDCDAILASSTLSADGTEVDDIGMTVSYCYKVELNVGTLGQSVTASVPFKLIHSPVVGSAEVSEKKAQKKARDIDIYQPDGRLIVKL